MTSVIAETDIDQILAEPHDPVIGVHKLTEYTFCDRAGLCSEDEDAADLGRDDHVAPLDFLPDYELDEIERLLRTFSMRAITWAAGCLITAGLARWLMQNHGARGGIVGGVAVLCLLGMLARDVVILVKLLKRRIRCLRSRGELPDPQNPEVEHANWWSFMNAGFTDQPFADGFYDEDLRLSGNPWKVLVRGNVMVPVFYRTRLGELRAQHYVRMAAYCLLIERQAGRTAPYGLILDAGTFDVLAIKFNRESLDLFRQRLLAARQVIREASQLGRAPDPPRRNVCAGCHFGRPCSTDSERSLELQQLTGLAAHAEIGNDGRRYHSHCGDRFDWVPPHQRAEELLLPNVGKSR